VRDPDAFAPAVEAAVAESRGGGVLVEELIEGPELTVNAVSVDGRFVPLTVTDRVLAEPPAFGVALAHVWPSLGPTDVVSEAARQAVAALGIENGPSYTQIRIGPDGRPYVMEVAARLGGGHDADLCRAALGVDLNGLAIGFALGANPRDKVLQDIRARVGGAAIAFLVAPEGELAAVEGLEEAESGEGMEWVRLHRQPGWRFGPLRRGADRAGAILATGPSREEALARARRAADTVRFQIDATAA
jgi:biotin carboxylase